MSQESCGSSERFVAILRWLLLLFELRLNSDVRPENSFRFFVVVSLGGLSILRPDSAARESKLSLAGLQSLALRYGPRSYADGVCGFATARASVRASMIGQK